ncbi:MAG: hypothetical protein Q8K26_00805 [Candidatus Gracilibacteria bacterium]|nr:hypothetical protein [Candidatus Gracilibacteria bacterium]
MLGIGLRCVLFAHEQADNNADMALLDSYNFLKVNHRLCWWTTKVGQFRNHIEASKLVDLSKSREGRLRGTTHNL